MDLKKKFSEHIHFRKPQIHGKDEEYESAVCCASLSHISVFPAGILVTIAVYLTPLVVDLTTLLPQSHECF